MLILFFVAIGHVFVVECYNIVLYLGDNIDG